MKILKYGNLTLKVDLDPRGEEIFIQELNDLVRASQSDFRWRKENADYLKALKENTTRDKIIPTEKKDALKSIVIKSENKNRKVKR